MAHILIKYVPYLLCSNILVLIMFSIWIIQHAVFFLFSFGWYVLIAFTQSTRLLGLFSLVLFSGALLFVSPQTSADHPYSVEQLHQRDVLANLGKQLFNYSFESSYATQISCSDCHQASHSLSAPQTFSPMASGTLSQFNTAALVRLDRQIVFGIAHLDPNLMAQVRRCFENSMAVTPAKLLFTIQSDKVLKAKITGIFGYLSAGLVYQILTQYLINLEFSPSKYDQFVAGEKLALSAPEIEGYELFMDQGCNHCHSGSELGGITTAPVRVKDETSWRKVPVLRNVIYTSPYLHDGSQASLIDTVQYMANEFGYRALSEAEAEKIVQFLATHTSSISDVSGEVFHAPR